MAIKKGFLKAYGNYDQDANAKRSAFFTEGPSLTVQSHRDDADINVIVRRFGVTGQVPSVMVPPTYGDFSGVSDYRSAIDLIRAADRSFSQLPSDVRFRFSNSPMEFVAFCNDPKNLPEMRKMGLAIPEEKPPATTEPVPPATGAPVVKPPEAAK